MPHGVFLEHLTWAQAEQVLKPEALVLLPLGAAAKEHGLHLPLDTDRRLATRLASEVAARRAVVVAPALTYHHYPAFAEYPGSTSLRLETARDLVVDVALSMARHGPRRFYVLNTGVSTLDALRPAAARLAEERVVLRFTDWPALLKPLEAGLVQQPAGSHADEVETSLMLALDPDAVDMAKAAPDTHPKGKGGLTRKPGGPGTHSPTGAWGDPTLASRAKGERLLAGVVEGLLRDLDALAATPLR